MFECEITRWQRTQKQMKSAQSLYDNMSPPDEPPSDEEIEKMRAKYEAQQEWLISMEEK